MAAKTKELHVEKKSRRGFPRPRLNQQEFCLKRCLLEVGLRRGKVESKGLGDERGRCPLRRLKFLTTSLLFGRDKEFALISLPWRKSNVCARAWCLGRPDPLWGKLVVMVTAGKTQASVWHQHSLLLERRGWDCALFWFEQVTTLLRNVLLYYNTK